MNNPGWQFGGFRSHPALERLIGPIPHLVPRWTAEDETNLAKRLARIAAQKASQ